MNWIRCGAGLMAAAVAIGAFAAHALKTRISADMQQVFEVGVRYHVYHALALFVVAWLQHSKPASWANAAGYCFLIGILFFSGSLYGYALSGVSRLAMFAPIGGSLFIIGWILVAISATK